MIIQYGNRKYSQFQLIYLVMIHRRFLICMQPEMLYI